MKYRRNFHTHTYLCKHGSGHVRDFCQAALEQGVDVLAFTDHTPYDDGRWNSVRMDMNQLPIYLAELEEARGEFPQLRIIKGMECEFVQENIGFIQDELKGRHGFQCIAGAIHSFLYKGEWVNCFQTAGGMDSPMLHAYTDFTIAAIQSGLFTFLAHPDLFGVRYSGWDDDIRACSHAIVQAAIQMDIPLEINANGFRKPKRQDGDEWRPQYPWHRFWEVAAEYGTNLKVLVGSDAHNPREVWGNNEQCIAFANTYALQLFNDNFLSDQPNYHS